MERRTVYTLAGLGGAVALAAALFGHAPQAAASSARVPADPGEVLEARPFPATDARSREIASLRRALTSKPDDLGAALRLAHLDIQLARERSDPRYLGHAQAALAPGWGEEAPPVDVLVLRATIEQSLHDFDAALRDLDRAVEGAPEHAQAWLTRAVVLTVRGRYDEARLSCAHLVPLASNLVVAVCQTSIDSLTGQAGPAYARLGEALRRAGRVSPDEEAWARSSLGEYALRAGKLDEADKSLRRALELDPEDGYVRAAFADLMLDRARPAEALALVRGREANDALLLRIALAEQRLHAPEASSHLDALAGRFEASRLRGDVVHRREEARFWLELRGDPARALELAKANWDVQKEPWDARILLEAARAAKAPAEAAPVLAWLAETKLEDPFLAKVAAELGPGAPR
jgi:tetratricopeptide (TPR) repeat protein